MSCSSSILVGGAIHKRVGNWPSKLFNNFPAAMKESQKLKEDKMLYVPVNIQIKRISHGKKPRKCPILVMQLPIKTSSIFVPATVDKSLASSGSLGAHRIGSLISSMLM